MSPASTSDRFAERARAVRRRPWLLAAAGLLVVLLVAGLGWLVRFSSLLDVREVHVSGVPTALASTVQEAAKAPMGEPLAGADLTAIGRRVTEVPEVERATVGRRWPHTVVVDVTPRTPVVAVAEGSRVRLVDRNAVAYATAVKAPEGVPVVAAAQTSDAAALRGVATTMAALPADLRREVSALTLHSASAISFRIGDTRVRWGDASQPQLKVKIVRALLEGEPNAIDVSAPQAPATS